VARILTGAVATGACSCFATSFCIVNVAVALFETGGAAI
jgi:hypothetical protein